MCVIRLGNDDVLPLCAVASEYHIPLKGRKIIKMQEYDPKGLYYETAKVYVRSTIPLPPFTPLSLAHPPHQPRPWNFQVRSWTLHICNLHHLFDATHLNLLDRFRCLTSNFEDECEYYNLFIIRPFNVFFYNIFF